MTKTALEQQITDILQNGTKEYGSLLYSIEQYKQGNCPLNDVEAAATSAMKELAGRQSSWISVEDRLPEKGGMYITYGEETLIEILYFTGTHFKNALEVVTHWQPLPAPPSQPIERESKDSGEEMKYDCHHEKIGRDRCSIECDACGNIRLKKMMESKDNRCPDCGLELSAGHEHHDCDIYDTVRQYRKDQSGQEKKQSWQVFLETYLHEGLSPTSFIEGWNACANQFAWNESQPSVEADKNKTI